MVLKHIGIVRIIKYIISVSRYINTVKYYIISCVTINSIFFLEICTYNFDSKIKKKKYKISFYIIILHFILRLYVI